MALADRLLPAELRSIHPKLLQGERITPDEGLTLLRSHDLFAVGWLADLAHLPGPTGCYDLKILAVARLLLDNIRAIKSYWVMLSPRLAQVGLHFGANDLDGTAREEQIYHRAGATTPLCQEQGDLIRMIREAGRVPLLRDSLYNVIKVYDSTPLEAESRDTQPELL